MPPTKVARLSMYRSCRAVLIVREAVICFVRFGKEKGDDYRFL